MYPAEVAVITKRIKALFPKSDWTEEMYALFAQRAGSLDITPDQAGPTLSDYRLSTRVRSPDMGTILRWLRERQNTLRGESSGKVDRGPMPWWRIIQRTHKYPDNWNALECLTAYHGRIAESSCTECGLSGSRDGQTLPQVKSSDEAYTDAWYGLAADLVRDGWDRHDAERAASAAFGERKVTTTTPTSGNHSAT